MAQELWTAVDTYIKEKMVPEDAVLKEALNNASDAGLPVIAVSPTQGKLLHLLARMCGARKILEIGTLGGYSTIWLARALPARGKIITLELDPNHARVARKNFELAGYSSVIELRLGSALELLPKLAAEAVGPFDLIFIDADKGNIPFYFEWALKLSHPGTAIVVDNIIRDGHVIDAKNEDPNIKGVRRFNDLLEGESRVSATEIQTVGEKGYDGFALLVVNPG
ncbi:MAG TPA: O-methyltransferase [Candidatus Acidoferrum sp.]|nr:O-methyltransferase [Candidatus Acidoferrum sp.]